MSEQLFRKTLIEQITNKLREEILLQDIPAGEHITTQSIAKRFDTSLTPVREAFQTLNGERLIKITPYKGAFVCDVDAKYLNDLYDIMRSLEVLVVERSFEVWTPQLSEEARRVNREYASYVAFMESQGGDAWMSPQVNSQCLIYNSAFHDPLFECCDNEQALSLFGFYRKIYHIARKRCSPLPLERRRESIREHEAIVDALDRRDLSGFREAYNIHSSTAKAAFLETLK